MSLSAELMSQIDDLQQKITELKVNDSTETRYALQNAAKDLISLATIPCGTFEDMIMESALPMIVVTAMNFQIFQKLVVSKGPMTADQLAKATGCPENLIIRIMRVLTAKKMAFERGPQIYEANDKTDFFATEGISEYMRRIHSLRVEAYLEIPRWVEQNRSSASPQPASNPFVSRHQKSFWEYLDHYPEGQAAFEKYMDVMYDPDLTQKSAEIVQTAVIPDIRSGSDIVALVDIGGSSGSLAKALSRLIPTAGRIVTQDRKSVLIDNNTYPNVESVEFDFFTPQSIHGARAYSLRHVLHDWSDSDCVKILQNTAKGMTKTWSSLFIFEMILPTVGCDTGSAFVDILMLTETGGRERSLEDWDRLLKAADLEIVSTNLIREIGNEWVIEAKQI